MTAPNWIDVTNPPTTTHAAPADGKFVTDGVIASGNLSQLTSTTGIFLSSDVNKLIAIAAPDGSFDHRTTIASFQNATTITLQAAAPAATSGALVVWGSDNAAKINLTIASGGDLANAYKGLSPIGGATAVSIPVLYFPTGIYVLNSATTGMPYMAMLGDNALLFQWNKNSQILNLASNTYYNHISGFTFISGTNQIYLANANIDKTIVEIIDCDFQLSNDFAIAAVPVSGSTHLSATLTVRKCRFVNPKQVLQNYCDSAVVDDCWISLDTSNFINNSAVFYNASGVLTLSKVFGVPSIGSVFVQNGKIASGSMSLTFPSAPTVPVHVGDRIIVAGAGASASDLVTTVDAVSSDQKTVTVHNAAQTTIPNFTAFVSYGNGLPILLGNGSISAGFTSLTFSGTPPVGQNDSIIVAGAGGSAAPEPPHLRAAAIVSPAPREPP